MKQNVTSHPALKRASIIVLAICSVVFSCSIVCQTTILNEQMFLDKLTASHLVEQKLEPMLDTLSKSAQGTKFNVEAVRSDLIEALTPDINEAVTKMVYYPDDAANTVEQTKSKILSNTFSALTNTSDDIKELIRSPLGDSIGITSAKFKEAVHFEQLQSLGYALQIVRVISIIGIIAAGILGLAALVMLFVLKQGLFAAIALAVGAIVDGILYLLAMFLPMGTGSFLQSIQQSFANGLGAAALIVAGAAILCGAVTYVINKMSNRS